MKRTRRWRKRMKHPLQPTPRRRKRMRHAVQNDRHQLHAPAHPVDGEGLRALSVRQRCAEVILEMWCRSRSRVPFASDAEGL